MFFKVTKQSLSWGVSGDMMHRTKGMCGSLQVCEAGELVLDPERSGI